MKTLSVLAFALLGATACYNPDLSDVQYVCDEMNPYCPDSLECIRGICGIADSEAPTPPGSSAGCRSGQGTQIGQAFACTGIFGAQQPPASQLCASDYRLCADATGVDQAACRMLGGFFAGAVSVRRSGTALACGYSAQAPYFAGCGGNSRGTVVELPAGQACAGFEQAIDCAMDNEWLCGSSSLDGSSQTSSADGVLCCPM